MTIFISILEFIYIQTYVMNLQEAMSNAPPTCFADEVCYFLDSFSSKLQCPRNKHG